MADTSQAELPPQTNGLSDSMDEEERNKMRPADIDADVREMERRKRVELIMNSKLFREELERIIEMQLKEGTGTTGLMQQISDMMGVSKNAGHVFKNSNCVVPINDIRGIEAMGYAKGEKILRCKLAAVYRLVDLYGWAQGCSTLITARLNQDEEHFLVNPYGMLFHEITASSLIKIDMQGNVVEQGTTNFSVNITAFSLHAAIHAARPDIKCIIHLHTPSVVAISALKCGLLPVCEEAVVIGDVSTHTYIGGLLSHEEIEKIARNLGPNNKVLLLTNQGAVCCGETIEEAFFNARNTVLACESQLKLIPAGIDNLVLITDETRKKLYDAAHKAPESTPRPDQPSILEGKVERKWRVGGIEFEALMRMLDNAGFRTGYIYRHPLVKGEPPKPRNDVEVPPAVSSLGYLLEEEELYRQGLWKKLEGGRKGNDRTRWLNSPNVYQKVEILETGTPDPKKITKWVADGSPTHATSTPVRIESALQFVPKNTNPKEFKQLQQQIKDYRRADKISAGPQSHILEGVTWEEARKMQDATVTQTGDQVVLMGAASKGIIQRGYQHNATMYKSPYAKNPFDSVTDEELDEYKKVVERKAKGDFDDTDYSESEGLSSAQINKRISDIRSPTSVTSETEEESRDEPQVLRIETTQAPKPSQPEVVLSDDDVFEPNEEEVLNQIKATAIEQVPIRAVSANSNRSTNAVRSKAGDECYRTNTYAGFPKGSYSIPNPTHYHIVRYTNISNTMRPAFISVLPEMRGRFAEFNPRIPRRCAFVGEDRRPSVTINVGDTHTVTLNVSMQTLREFIYPFAAALNLQHFTSLRNTSSQTSYINIEDQHVSITEINGNHKNGDLNASGNGSSDSFDNLSEYEANILRKLRENLLSEVGNNRSSSSELDESNVEIEAVLKSNCKQVHFDDRSNHDLQAKASKSEAKEVELDAETNEEKASLLEKYQAVVKEIQLKFNRTAQEAGILSDQQEHSNTTTVEGQQQPDKLFSNIQKLAEKVTDSALNISDDFNIFEAAVKQTLDLLKQLPFNGVDLIEPKSHEINSEQQSGGDAMFINQYDEDFQEKSFEEFETIRNSRVNDHAEDFFRPLINVADNNLFQTHEKHVDDGNEITFSSLDEGISDCRTPTLNTSTNLTRETSLDTETFDDKIIEMADLIFNYIIRQCYEIKELVLFPEVCYDENVNKMFLSLQELYSKYYQDITSEAKNELRIKMAYYILKRIEVYDLSESTSDSENSQIVSDKIFTISEFVSDILDRFFEQISDDADLNSAATPNSANWEGFSHSLAESVSHSTPDNKKSKCDATKGNKKQNRDLTLIPPPPKKFSPFVEDTTSFESKKSRTGNVLYWISVHKSPKNETPSPPPCNNRKCVNVDDIPLQPPPDLDNSLEGYRKHCLSPIIEEPRCRLFEKFEEAEREDSLKLSNYRNSPIIEETHCILFDKFGEAEREDNLKLDAAKDFLAGGDYFSFEQSEVNIVVCDSVSFHRINTINTASYTQQTQVTFVPKINDNPDDAELISPSSHCSLESLESYKSISQQVSSPTGSVDTEYRSVQGDDHFGDDNDEGNWLGFHTARF